MPVYAEGMAVDRLSTGLLLTTDSTAEMCSLISSSNQQEFQAPFYLFRSENPIGAPVTENKTLPADA